MPRIDIDAIPEKGGSGYPEPFRRMVEGRLRKRLGDAGGLTQFGVNLCRLRPGASSSIRHWHHNEDEFVYVLEGEVVLLDDGGETVLAAGEAAAFKAGVANGHNLVNRGARDAVFLEVGTRAAEETAEYPDVDLRAVKTSGGFRFTRKDGAEY